MMNSRISKQKTSTDGITIENEVRRLKNMMKSRVSKQKTSTDGFAIECDQQSEEDDEQQDQ